MRTISFSKILLIGALAFALPFAAFSQGKKEAVDAYNTGATMIKENPEEALNKLYESLKISEGLGEEGEETKVLAESLIPGAHFSLAMKLYKEKKTVETLEQLEKAEETAVKYNDAKTQASVEKTIPKFYYAMGVTSYKEENFDKSIEYYNKAIHFKPDYTDPFLGIALSYEKKNDNEKMIEYLKKTIEVGTAANDVAKVDDAKKKAKSFYLRSGDEAQKAEKYAEAIESFIRAQEFNGDDGSILYQLSINYNLLKDWDNAIKNATLALEKGSETIDKAGVYYQLGVSYEGKGDKEEACKAYSNALSGNYKANAEYKMKEVLKCN